MSIADTEQLIDRLRDAGERITLQRRLVLAVLCNAPPHQHLTVSEIATAVAKNPAVEAIPEPTVYRILQWLKDGGWVSQTDMAEDGTVYQLITDPPHHHLICLNCGTVHIVDDTLLAGLRGKLLDAHGFHARLDHLALYGVCAGCANTTQ